MKNFLIRAIIGCVLIFGINQLFQSQNLPINVGLNAITFLTSGVLGFPGVALLYGIMALQIL